MTRELTWELATGKLPIEGMRLDKVMVFYHNDQEEGFGVGLDGSRPGSNLEADLHRAFEAYKLHWDNLVNEEHRQRLLDFYLAQVKAAARHRGENRYPIALLILNIIWLSSYGRIPNDEYNGTQFIWASGPSCVENREEVIHE